ncbi:MAG TPA: methyltransferase domain-containing protein, partial [Gammaproteobacteria bacterium]|nr:methyltransferase domain-containing protein [Gammaproteobacteria bacterium]
QQGAPLEYVRALFDQYAFNYDTHVKTMLNYQVPEKMRQAIAPFATKATKAWDVLDLGCGTGLCAPYFTDVAGKMVGVDISPNMIEVANQKGGYHKLHVEDALNFLAKTQYTYDLIIAADVFVYFAELHAILSAIGLKLVPQGFCIFSIEKCEDSEGPFILRKTGRYAHSASYLQTLCAQLHLLVLFQEETILRKQEDQDVYGYIIIVQKISV